VKGCVSRLPQMESRPEAALYSLVALTATRVFACTRLIGFAFGGARIHMACGAPVQPAVESVEVVEYSALANLLLNALEAAFAAGAASRTPCRLP
jgi:hypothetical protein